VAVVLQLAGDEAVDDVRDARDDLRPIFQVPQRQAGCRLSWFCVSSPSQFTTT
jgi:hypothetical protein